MNQTKQEIQLYFKSTLQTGHRIGIITHHNPDGDGLAASLALHELISNTTPLVDIILEAPAPDRYDYLLMGGRCLVYNSTMQYDLLFILDCHSEDRLGVCAGLLRYAKKVFIIDHHLENHVIPNDFYYSDTEAVSVGAILFRLFEELFSELKHESRVMVANCIYTTVLNDTDDFINANVNKEVFEICARLMDFGLNPNFVVTKFLFNHSAKEMRFVGQTLSTIETFQDGKILFLDSTLKNLVANNLPDDATSKMVRWVRSVKETAVTVYFKELEKDRYKISLRSDVIDVNQIALQYGGGGHKNASGCTIEGSLPFIKQQLLNDITKSL